MQHESGFSELRGNPNFPGLHGYMITRANGQTFSSWNPSIYNSISEPWYDTDHLIISIQVTNAGLAREELWPLIWWGSLEIRSGPSLTLRSPCTFQMWTTQGQFYLWLNTLAFVEDADSLNLDMSQMDMEYKIMVGHIMLNEASPWQPWPPCCNSVCAWQLFSFMLYACLALIIAPIHAEHSWLCLW